MIGDPYKKAVSGQPLRPEAAAWNRFLDVAGRRGDGGSGSPEFVGERHLTVLVKNNTGGDLPALSVLKIGASVFTDWTKLLRNLDSPMFGGSTPAAATDAFAVLVEPVKDGKFGLGVVSGVVPVEVNVTSAGHGFAAPGATTARLTSASSGPARILDRESGTGNKKAWVLLDDRAGAALPTVARVDVGGTSEQLLSGGTYTNNYILLRPQTLYLVLATYRLDLTGAVTGGVYGWALWNDGDATPTDAGTVLHLSCNFEWPGTGFYRFHHSITNVITTGGTTTNRRFGLFYRNATGTFVPAGVTITTVPITEVSMPA